MSAVWGQNNMMLDHVNADDGRAFSRYLPLNHPAPTPYHTWGYADVHNGPFAANVNAFEKTWPQAWIKPWFNDPSRLLWDEDNQLWRGYSISNSNPETNGDETQQTWTEIVSPDLITFINNRIPLYTRDLPYPQLWGGSVLIDTAGAAGYGVGAILYYISLPGSDTSPLQCVALWIAPKLGLAPVYHGVVLNNPGVGSVVHAPGLDFRDPRVMWEAERQQFVMALTIGYGIAFYASKDGMSWAFLSLIDLSAWQQIETPDLVPMSTPGGAQKWLLAFSIKQWNGQEASSVAYLVGDWNGTTFCSDFAIPKRFNWGADYYAQAITQHEGQTYCWGWMGNWPYMELPQQGFGGNHSLITQLRLEHDNDGSLGLRMAFLPNQQNSYASFDAAVPSLLLSSTGTSSWTPAIRNPGVSWRLDMQLVREGPTLWSDAIILSFAVGSHNQTTLTLCPKAGTCTLSRSNAGAGPLDHGNAQQQALWNADQTATLPNRGRYDITLIVDVSTVEIIINNERYLSCLIFPPDDAFGIALNVSGAGATRLYFAKLSA